MTAAREAAEREYPALMPDDDVFTNTRKEIRDAARWAFVSGWNAALEAARNEILDITVILNGAEFVFAEDVRDDLYALEDYT